MGPSLGLLEVKSIARGLVAADAMAKEAPVDVVFTRVVEPGKHLTLLAGEVDDLRTALRRGRAAAADDFQDEMLIPNPHPSLLPALGAAGRVRPPSVDALGTIETLTVASALLAADAAAKQAHVRLLQVRIGADLAGKGVVLLTGEVADVESSVSAGARVAEAHGALHRTAVIARPAPALVEAALREGGP